MNQVVLIGRITKNIELKYTQNNKAITRFSIAVNRNFKNANGDYEADFINCMAFGNKAEILSKYCKKGDKIGINGRIQTGSYDDKNGNKVYTTEIVVDELEFCSTGTKNEQNETTKEEVKKEEVDPFAEFGNSIETEQTSIDLDDFLD